MFSSTADPRLAKRSLREAVRRAADLVVAFATLADELPPRVHADDLVEAHPHRRPLRAPSRAGRPGGVPSRAHSCTTPVASRPQRHRRISSVR
jgi:hypothetical protein